MNTIADPFVAAAIDQGPASARLEILEFHRGAKWGRDRPIVPNGVRINGVRVHCPTDDPILIREIRVSDECHRPIIVVLRLQARALSLGVAAIAVPGGTLNSGQFSVVEIPKLDTVQEPLLSAPYAVVDGQKLLLAGEVSVFPGTVGDHLVVVDLPLVCRSVVFDDESTDTAQ